MLILSSEIIESCLRFVIATSVQEGKNKGAQHAHDNFLIKSYHEQILQMMSGDYFPWYYYDNITVEETNNLNEYGFSHMFWDEETGPRNSTQSCLIKSALLQIMDIAECNRIIRSRGKMITHTGKKFTHHPHVDYHFPHIASIYYVNDSDGDTIFLPRGPMRLKKPIVGANTINTVFLELGEFVHVFSQARVQMSIVTCLHDALAQASEMADFSQGEKFIAQWGLQCVHGAGLLHHGDALLQRVLAMDPGE